MAKMKIIDIIGKAPEGFLLVSEARNIFEYFAALDEIPREKHQESFQQICAWIERFGGQRGKLEWQKTGLEMKCWHGVFLKNLMFEDKRIYEHLGKGCLKWLTNKKEYGGW